MGHTCTEKATCSKGIENPTRRDCRDCSLANYGRNCYNDKIEPADAAEFGAMFFGGAPSQETIDNSPMYRTGYRMTGNSCAACDADTRGVI
jgi:hypothetical protein